MVDQVRADVRRVLHDRDPVPAQLLRRADPGAHQQLRRIERAGRQDHFRARVEHLDAPVARDSDAGRPLAVERDAQHRRIGDHMQVRPVAAIDVRAGDAAARAVAVRDLVEADAFLCRAVEVVVQRIAGRVRGLDESFGERIAKAQIRHRERAVRAMPRIGAARVAFRTTEIRQHVLPAPARRAELRPFVVVARVAARVDHRVDRARAAHPAPARLVAAPPAEARLRHRLVAVVRAEFERHQCRDADRHVDEQVALRVRAGLDQRDRRIGAGIGETACQARAARTAADDDVVVLHVTSPSCHERPPRDRVPSCNVRAL